MTYTPLSITLPLELIVTARRTENGECELDTIAFQGWTLPPIAFTQDQLRDLRAEWLDANEAAERDAKSLSKQP